MDTDKLSYFIECVCVCVCVYMILVFINVLKLL